MQQTPRRYFFGIQPPESIRVQLEQGCEAGRFGAGPFHHPLDWHLTLAFLGELSVLPEDLMAQVSQVQIPAFDLCLDRIEYWPKPQVLVLCSTEPPQILFDLVRQIWKGLENLGLEPEQRPFRPHLTLGRKAAPMPPGSCVPALCWTVKEFGLFISDWCRPAPRYRQVASQTL